METAYIADNQQTLLGRLFESERQFTAAAAVPEACARVRPVEGSWSVLEVVEHIALSDRAMLEPYRDAGENTHPVDRDAERFIATVGRDLTNRRQAPPQVHPTGRFASPAGAWQQYRRTRAEIVHLIESSDEDFRTKRVLHPVMEMDGYQLFLLIAAHSERHTRQIETLKESARYRAANRQRTAS
jgi:hypothetical protein